MRHHGNRIFSNTRNNAIKKKHVNVKRTLPERIFNTPHNNLIGLDWLFQFDHERNTLQALLSEIKGRRNISEVDSSLSLMMDRWCPGELVGLKECMNYISFLASRADALIVSWAEVTLAERKEIERVSGGLV